MLQIEYIKDLYNSYMVIKGEKEENTNYETHMLTYNDINGFVQCELRTYDGIELFYYDITEKKDLKKKYQSSLFSYKDVVNLLVRIFHIIESAYEYLLVENSILLEPNYIFYHTKTDEISLCYVAGYQADLKEQLSELLEYLINKVDYKDGEAVLFVHTFYKKSKDIDTTYEELKEDLQKNLTKGQDKQMIKKVFPTEWEKPEYKNVEEELQEELEEEREVSYYPLSTYTKAGGFIIAGIVVLLFGYFLGLFHNRFHTGIEPIKLLSGLLVVSFVEIYILIKLFDTQSKSTRIETVTKESYSQSCCKGKQVEQQEKRLKGSPLTALLWKKHDSRPTEVLAILNKEHTYSPKYSLLPKEDNYNPSFSMESFPFLIGKESTKVSIAINDSAISRIHCKFEIQKGGLFLTDLGSTNGTYIEGEKLQERQSYKVEEGDIICISHLMYQLKRET